jgi:predicted DNA binding protein
MVLTDKKYTNEHPKYTMFDKYKADKESLTKNYKADISEMDINASKMKGYSAVNLETAKELSMNPTLTEEELQALKKAVKDKKKLEPTGQFKKL